MTYPPAKDKLIWSLAALCLCFGCDEDKIAPQAKLTSPGPRPDQEDRPAPNAPPCPRWRAAEASEHATNATLHEISGLVATSSSGALWVHNDSGNDAKIYALQTNGALAATVSLSAPSNDWEDIARQPRQGKPAFLYIADTGDNLSIRKEGLELLRFEEPDLKLARSKFPEALEGTQFETMRVRFPQGPADVEALLVDPLSDEILLITKPRMELPEIYSTNGFSKAATLKFEGRIAPEHCGQLIHLVTAADISPDGRWILVRTYDDILLFERREGQTMSAALQGRACFVPHAREPQGEAIGFLPTPGDSGESPPSFVTISEGLKQPVLRYEVDPRTK